MFARGKLISATQQKSRAAAKLGKDQSSCKDHQRDAGGSGVCIHKRDACRSSRTTIYNKNVVLFYSVVVSCTSEILFESKAVTFI